MWIPRVEGRDGPIYRAIVDALQEDVGQGHLKPGTQLPTQRALADALNITVSTVTRAYGEAKRIGLIDGEVGRGTYVRQSVRSDTRESGARPEGRFVDLMLNRPALGALDVHLREGLSRMVHDDGLESCLDYPPVGGFERHRAAGAAWVGRVGVKTDASSVVVCNGAQQALLAALSALAGRGAVVATEELNYPGIRRIAEFLGLSLVGLPLDADGLDPEDFAAACKKHNLSALVCTPCSHNPTTVTMPIERRRQVLKTALGRGVTIIENDVHGPLGGRKVPTLFALSEGATVYVSSVSKAMAPGLRIGYLVCTSPALAHRCAEVVHTSTWGAPPLVADLVSHWIDTGVADRFVEHHLHCAEERVLLARKLLAGSRMRTATNCYHAWLELPPGVQTEDFAMNLRMRNVATTPGTWFSVTGAPVKAIRLSLGSAKSVEELESGLERIAEALQGRTLAPLI
jgi:DNA-binding transcriptional MocR family regulator